MRGHCVIIYNIHFIKKKYPPSLISIEKSQISKMLACWAVNFNTPNN